MYYEQENQRQLVGKLFYLTSHGLIKDRLTFLDVNKWWVKTVSFSLQALASLCVACSYDSVSASYHWVFIPEKVKNSLDHLENG